MPPNRIDILDDRPVPLREDPQHTTCPSGVLTGKYLDLVILLDV
jgi:hypothetical protein